jgi:hypothetical protein
MSSNLVGDRARLSRSARKEDRPNLRARSAVTFNSESREIIKLAEYIAGAEAGVLDETFQAPRTGAIVQQCIADGCY